MPNNNDSIITKIKGAVSKKLDPKSGTSQMLDRYWNSAQSSRSELDWKWFQYDLWYNGNHYAKWDKNTQQIVSVNPRADGRPKVTINKIYSTLRSVRSHVLMNEPKAEVTPNDLSDQNVDQAMYLNRYLDYLHNHLHLQASLRATMLHALKYSVGWWQILWDEEKQEIMVNVVDPYDLYVDPVARLPKEARYMILAVRRSIDDLKEDPKYKGADWDSIVGTDTLAASTLKSRVLQFEKGASSFNDGEKEHGSVILKEFWYKENGKVMLCAKVGEEVVRKPEDTGLDRLPFFRLCSDIEPLSMYGQGWCKNLIPLNRMLETNESSVMEYNVVVNKGRYSMPKNAGVKTITNQHGIFVEHKEGKEITPLAIPQLSNIIETQTQRINQYIEDIGCQHDASRGQGSPDATSGVAIEALQEGDSTNLSELTENTSEFLEDCYEYMLYILSEKLVTAKNVITSTETGEKMFFKVIGEQAEDDLKSQKGQVVTVPKECAVDVKIASYMAYTSEGRRQAIQQLASLPQMANLPPEVILKAYNIGGIADIINDMREEQARQAQEQQAQEQAQQQAQTQNQMQLSSHNAQIQQQQQAQQAQMQQQQQTQQAQTEQQNAPQQPPDMGQHQAIAFIRQLINAVDHGNPLPKLPKPITPTFIAYLTEFEKSPEGQANPEIVQAIEMIKDHATLQMKGGGAVAQN